MQRINPGTIAFNKNIANPSVSSEYFDENYAAGLRPNYSSRLKKFDNDDEKI